MLAAPRPPVFLLGGRLNTLSAARSLGSRGIDVRVLDHRGEAWFVARSRYCAHYLDTPSGCAPGEWWLETLKSEGQGGVVFPCNDVALELLARNSAELAAKGCRPIESNPEALLTSLDKEATYRAARELGISTPKTIQISKPADLALASAQLEWPYALKPVSSHRLWRALHDAPELFALWLAHPKGKVLDHESQLEELCEPLLEMGVEMLATEVIVGPDSGYCSYYTYLLPDGEPLLHFTKRKPRQHPIHFGEGTFHVTAWQPDVAELGLRLFQGLGLRGICNVEFKRDVRRNELRLVEINARLTASDDLERQAGLDLPWIAYSRVIQEPLSVPDRFPDGLCQWLPRRDFRAFRAYRQAGELSTSQWLRSLAHRQSFTVFSSRDLGPIAAVARRSARSRARRALGGNREGARVGTLLPTPARGRD